MTRSRTPAEIRSYNQGVSDMLALLVDAAVAVTAIGKRPIHEAFAACTLDEMAHAGRSLLISPDAPPPMPALPPRPLFEETTP